MSRSPADLTRRARSARSCSGQERAEALALLAAGGAAVEVLAHPGYRGVRVARLELQLDVLVEALEALVAADVRPGRAEQPPQAIVRLAHPLTSSMCPAATSSARSFVRASCSVL